MNETPVIQNTISDLVVSFSGMPFDDTTKKDILNKLVNALPAYNFDVSMKNDTRVINIEVFSDKTINLNFEVKF